MKKLRLYHTLQQLRARRDAILAERRSASNLAKAAVTQAGVTLLEIMIVLAIIALVMGVLVGPTLLETFGESQAEVAKLQIGQLADQAYVRWAMKNQGKRCPDSLDELTKYTNKKDIKDPWGADYIMHCGDNAPPDKKFGVSSYGEDGKENTDDDIKSWDAR
ncbi:MAG: type II secretion system protein GspG [Myxococcota bacterium]